MMVATSVRSMFCSHGSERALAASRDFLGNRLFEKPTGRHLITRLWNGRVGNKQIGAGEDAHQSFLRDLQRGEFDGIPPHNQRNIVTGEQMRVESTESFTSESLQPITCHGVSALFASDDGVAILWRFEVVRQNARNQRSVGKCLATRTNPSNIGFFTKPIGTGYHRRYFIGMGGDWRMMTTCDYWRKPKRRESCRARTGRMTDSSPWSLGSEARDRPVTLTCSV